MAKYNVYNGQFPCHECTGIAKNARFWYATYDFSFKCPNGHITTVSLVQRRG